MAYDVYWGFWWGSLKGSDHFQTLGVDGRIMLKGIGNKLDEKVMAGFI